MYISSVETENGCYQCSAVQKCIGGKGCVYFELLPFSLKLKLWVFFFFKCLNIKLQYALLLQAQWYAYWFMWYMIIFTANIKFLFEYRDCFVLANINNNTVQQIRHLESKAVAKIFWDFSHWLRIWNAFLSAYLRFHTNLGCGKQSCHIQVNITH